MQVKLIVKLISYLIAIISIIPVIPYVKIFYIAAFFIFLILSFKFEFEKRLFLNIAGILAIILSLKDISFNNMIIPVLNSIIALLCIKFVEKKKFRDYMQIYLLSIFSLAGYSLLSLNISFLIYLLFDVLLLIIATVFLTYFDENEDFILTNKVIIKISKFSILLFILSIPIAIIIYFILPRINSPIFDLFNKDKAVTGFSDRITIGDVKDIQEDNSVIFRVKMKKIPEKYLYWRGITLDYFNGLTWEKKANESEKHPVVKGELVKQIIFLEPYNNKVLFALDKPIEINIKKAIISDDFTIKYPSQIYRRIKYQVLSVLADSYSEISKFNKNQYLEIPQNISKKIINLGKKLKNLKNIIKYFKNNNFKYSLTSLPVSNHPLEKFLFEDRKGNCEYFASAFAILLRSIGIPSRIVAGYKGGIYSKLGGYYIVLQSDAHVWVEAYIDKKWQRIDPTKFAKSVLIPSQNNIYNLRMILDLINYYWIALFINYDFNTQVGILIKMSNFKINKNLLLKILIFIFLIFFIFFILKKVKFRKNYEKLLYDFLKIMKEFGVERKKGETLDEFVEKLKDSNIKKLANEFISVFQEIYFKDMEFTRERINHLKKVLKELKHIQLLK